MPSFQGKDDVDLLNRCDQILLTFTIHIFHSSLICSSFSLYSTQVSVVLTTVNTLWTSLVCSLLVSNLFFTRDKHLHQTGNFYMYQSTICWQSFMRSRESMLVSSSDLIRTKMFVLSSPEQLAPFKLFSCRYWTQGNWYVRRKLWKKCISDLHPYVRSQTRNGKAAFWIICGRHSFASNTTFKSNRNDPTKWLHWVWLFERLDTIRNRDATHSNVRAEVWFDLFIIIDASA
jgi:hypothetical protein